MLPSRLSPSRKLLNLDQSSNTGTAAGARQAENARLAGIEASSLKLNDFLLRNITQLPTQVQSPARSPSPKNFLRNYVQSRNVKRAELPVAQTASDVLEVNTKIPTTKPVYLVQNPGSPIKLKPIDHQAPFKVQTRAQPMAHANASDADQPIQPTYLLPKPKPTQIAKPIKLQSRRNRNHSPDRKSRIESRGPTTKPDGSKLIKFTVSLGDEVPTPKSPLFNMQ